MTEREWLQCDDPARLIDHLGYRLTERQARFFAVACCRRIWHRFEEERLRRLVDVAERFARGEAGRKERLAAEVQAVAFLETTLPLSTPLPFDSSPLLAAVFAVWEGPSCHRSYLWSNDPDYPLSQERAAQAALLRDIVVWPGRPVRLHPAWLTPTVRELARAVEQDGDFGRLPILADALEDAGCTDATILAHCRGGLVHVPGCWLVRELTEAPSDRLT
jgi:hypothetical protein